jgi:hypothetical protein
MWQHFSVLMVKHQKVSLNRRPSAHTGGGAGSHPTPDHMIPKWMVSPNTWSHDTETDGQRNICHGSSGRPRALLEIYSKLSHDCRTPNILIQNYFCLGKTNIAWIDSRRYMYKTKVFLFDTVKAMRPTFPYPGCLKHEANLYLSNLVRPWSQALSILSVKTMKPASS